MKKEKKGLEMNPSPSWRSLFEFCGSCGSRVWTQDILCNAGGEFIFKVTCFKCGQTENYQMKAKDIANQCSDLDFMAFIKVKN